MTAQNAIEQAVEERQAVLNRMTDKQRMTRVKCCGRPAFLCSCSIDRALQEEEQKRIAECPCLVPGCRHIAMWRFPDGQVCYNHALERAGLQDPILPGFEAAVKQYGLIDALIAPYLRADARDDLSRGHVGRFIVRSKEGNTRHLDIVAQNVGLFLAIGVYEKALLAAWSLGRDNRTRPTRALRAGRLPPCVERGRRRGLGARGGPARRGHRGRGDDAQAATTAGVRLTKGQAQSELAAPEPLPH